MQIAVTNIGGDEPRADLQAPEQAVGAGEVIGACPVEPARAGGGGCGLDFTA